jgi:hypothetical protein
MEISYDTGPRLTNILLSGVVPKHECSNYAAFASVKDISVVECAWFPIIGYCRQERLLT